MAKKPQRIAAMPQCENGLEGGPLRLICHSRSMPAANGIHPLHGSKADEQFLHY